MAKILNWNAAAFEAECINVGMDILEETANLLADEMEATLLSKTTGNWREHGPYLRHYVKKRKRDKSGRFTTSDQGKQVDYSHGFGPLWTARRHDALAKTIRVTRKHDLATRNVWIIAGNWAVWWALQTEFGKGGWQGGRKSFIRPAMAKAPQVLNVVLESGNAETKGFEGYLK